MTFSSFSFLFLFYLSLSCASAATVFAIAVVIAITIITTIVVVVGLARRSLSTIYAAVFATLATAVVFGSRSRARSWMSFVIALSLAPTGFVIIGIVVIAIVAPAFLGATRPFANQFALAFVFVFVLFATPVVCSVFVLGIHGRVASL